jgi:hypothetical protein
MKQLTFGVNYKPIDVLNHDEHPADVFEMYKRDRTQRTFYDKSVPVENSILLTRDELEELLERFLNAYNLSSVNYPPTFVSQYISSLIKTGKQ